MHDITVENITGVTGDDSVALTGLRRDDGALGMQVGGYGKTDRDDIYNITVRNVRTRVAGGHHIVRVLNHDGVRIHNVFIRDVMDASTDRDKRPKAAVKIGDARYWSVSKNQLGDTSRIIVDNMLSRAANTVLIQGPLRDSVVRNIVGYGGNAKLVERGDAPVENVVVDDAHQF